MAELVHRNTLRPDLTDISQVSLVEVLMEVKRARLMLAQNCFFIGFCVCAMPVR